MLNLNVCKREGGNEGQDTRYWWYCWDLYAVGVFCIFLSADIITRKSWCNDIEAMAKVNILPQQVQTIGTFFSKKGERLCFWELEISIISSCRSSRAALSFPPNAPSRDRDTSWFQEWDGRRLPFDLLALWISSWTSLSVPAGLGGRHFDPPAWLPVVVPFPVCP